MNLQHQLITTAFKITVRTLLNPIEPVLLESNNDTVFRRFEHDTGLLVLPVVDAEYKPVGLISRYSLIDRFVRPFRRELFGKKPCTLFMDDAPVIVDHETSVCDIGRFLGKSAHHHMLDGFIITENGKYIGVGSSQAVMTIITDMQVHAARYSNPLTQLPGNVPINEHIDYLLASGVSFVACYCDLDHFKPYNDTYGYRRGDDLIQFLGNILISICSPNCDFVGHIGGDDFMLLLQSENWQERLNHGLRQFDAGMANFLEAQHLQAGGYPGEDRRGLPVFHSPPSLSIGCLIVKPEVFCSPHDVSSAVVEAKKQAKKIKGSSIFVERRCFDIQVAKSIAIDIEAN